MSKVDRNEIGWSGVDGNGVEWILVEWNEKKWNREEKMGNEKGSYGVERNEME